MSGYGKTSLMANLALDDIERRDGAVIVIDPKGSEEGLVQRILQHIPESMIPDVFYLSLRNPVPVDMMSYQGQSEKNLIRGDIITILKRFSYGSWGPTMQATLNHLVPTLLEAEDSTFLDIGRFLDFPHRKTEILKQVSPARRDYWENNPASKADSSPITSRMSNFYENPLRTIVNCKRGEGISISDIIEKKQVLLVDTSPLSEDGLMLGALVMSRIQQAIFRRSGKYDPVCHVYADEFHNFQTSAFNVMLSQARSFNLSLCLANQHPKQIADIWDDIVGCVSTYMIFRLHGDHAYMLRSKLQEPEAIVTHLQAPWISNPNLVINKRDIAGRKQFLFARKHYLETTHEDVEGWGAELSKVINDIDELDDYVERLRDHSSIKKADTFLDQIPHLPIGEAIFIDQSGYTARVRTPKPPCGGSDQYIPAIIEHTRQAAGIGTKRTGDNYASQVPQKMLELEEDDGPTLLPDGIKAKVT
jgi:hypothetical protein